MDVNISSCHLYRVVGTFQNNTSTFDLNFQRKRSRPTLPDGIKQGRGSGFYYPPEVSSMKYCCLGVSGRNTSGSSINSANRKSWVVKIRNTSEAVLSWPLY